MRYISLFPSLVTVVSLASPTLASTVNPEDPSFPKTNVASSVQPPSSVLALIDEKVLGDLASKPSLHHQVITHGFRDFFDGEVRILKDLYDKAETKEEILEKLRTHLEEAKKTYNEHQRIKEKYKTFTTEEDLKSYLNNFFMQQKSIFEKYPADSLDFDTQSEREVALKNLTKAKERLEIINIPLDNRRQKVKLLEKQIAEKEKDLNINASEGKEDLQETIIKKRQIYLEALDIKSKTVYDFSSLLPRSQGYLFSKTYPLIILEKIFPTLKTEIEKFDGEVLWQHFVRSLELPSYRLPLGLDSPQEAYRKQVDTLIQVYEERLKEDALCFETLCGFLISHNKGAARKNRPLISLNLEMANKEEEESLSKYIILQNEEKAHLKEHLKEISIPTLRGLLKNYEATLDIIGEKLLDAPLGLLGRFLGSLHKGRDFYSWESDRSTLVAVRSFLRQDKLDISKELTQSLYTLLARTLNKHALELISQDIKTATAVQLPPIKAPNRLTL